MAREYKRTKQAVKREKIASRRSINFTPLKWISVGAILGISIIVILPRLPLGNLADQMKNLSLAAMNPQKKQNDTAAARDLTSQEKKQPPPSFDFYTLLPEMKVEVPQDDSKTKMIAQAPAPTTAAPASTAVPATVAAAAPTPTSKALSFAAPKPAASIARQAPPATTKQSAGYSVQIAAFKNFSDADAAKTQLLVSGFPVRLQTSTSSTGELLHLIKMGPYKNKDFAQRDRQRLVAMNYKQAVVIPSNK